MAASMCGGKDYGHKIFTGVEMDLHFCPFQVNVLTTEIKICRLLFHTFPTVHISLHKPRTLV